MNRHSSGQLQTVVGWIFGGGFTFLGLIFVIIGGFEFRQGLRTNDWPAAAGGIAESKITETPRTRNDYVVNVRYSYEVDGQKFEGNGMRHGTQSHRLSKAMDERALFPPGMEVQVYWVPVTDTNSQKKFRFDVGFTTIPARV